MWLVIDHEGIVAKILRGNGTVGTHFHVGFAPNEATEELYQLPGYRREADGGKSLADLAEGKRLLAEAGYPDGFSGTISSILTGCTATQAQLISQVWKRELNLDMNIVSTDVATRYANWRSNDYEVITSCGSGIILPDPSDILNQWYGTDTMRNSLNWTTPEFDLLKDAQNQRAGPRKAQADFCGDGRSPAGRRSPLPANRLDARRRSAGLQNQKLPRAEDHSVGTQVGCRLVG